MPDPIVSESRSHAPQGSFFFEKVVPVLFIGLGAVAIALILFAVAVLVGLIRF